MDDYRPVPLAYERPTEDAALESSRAFLAILEARRSVRRFSPEPVPLELVENAIRAAGTAPSGAHQQPWTFVLVSDPEVKRRLREGAEAEEREFYDRRATPEWLEAVAPIGTDWIKTHITDAPFGWLSRTFRTHSGDMVRAFLIALGPLK